MILGQAKHKQMLCLADIVANKTYQLLDVLVKNLLVKDEWYSAYSLVRGSMDTVQKYFKYNAPTVFVVDDESDIRSALVWLLECVGLYAEAYPSAESFLDNYQPERPGCLVLDISMPKVSGLELQRILNERNIRIPIIFLTGKADIPKAVRAFKGGAFDFLEKPVSDETILSCVRNAIAIDDQNRKREELRALNLKRIDRLTQRELEVLRLLVNGKSNSHIALNLQISTRTVEGHRFRVMEKMQADSLPDLIKMVHSAGLI